VIRFTCIWCGVKYAVKPSMIGKTLACDGCAKPMRVPKPERVEVVEVEEVDDDVPEAVVVEDDRPAKKKKQQQQPDVRRRERGLIVHGDNASVELVGSELVFRHSGSFAGHGGRVRAGTYRHKVLGLTKIEYVEPDVFGQGGRMRFVFGNERLDADVDYVLDTQTVTFSAGQGGDFLHFKKEVERFRRWLIEQVRMNR
jgi:hypothetical protein